jgi:hypothetical protein
VREVAEAVALGETVKVCVEAVTVRVSECVNVQLSDRDALELGVCVGVPVGLGDLTDTEALLVRVSEGVKVVEIVNRADMVRLKLRVAEDAEDDGVREGV